MEQFAGRCVTITGAASGIGRALAVQFAATGARLALADKDRAGLEQTLSLCRGAEVPLLFEVDVSQRQAVEQLSVEVAQTLGGVDILINNAGVSSSGAIGELTYETLKWTLDINLWGVIHGTLAFLPHLLAKSHAQLVNVSSVYGLIGVPGQAAYCTSKFAVRGFTEAIRQDLRGTGVAVTLVFPGGVRTQIVKNSRSDSKLPTDEQARQRELFEQALTTSPEEAARTIIDGIRRKARRVLIGSDARSIDWMARLCPANYDTVVGKHANRFR